MQTSDEPRIYQSKLLWPVWGLLCALVLLSALSIGYFAAQQVADDARIAIEESLGPQVRLLKQLHDPLILQNSSLPTIESDQRVTVLDQKGAVLSDNREAVTLMENHLNRPEIIAASTATAPPQSTAITTATATPQQHPQPRPQPPPPPLPKPQRHPLPATYSRTAQHTSPRPNTNYAPNTLPPPN